MVAADHRRPPTGCRTLARDPIPDTAWWARWCATGHTFRKAFQVSKTSFSASSSLFHRRCLFSHEQTTTVRSQQSRAEQSRTPPPSPSPSPSGPDQLLRYYYSSSPRAPLPFYGPPAVLETCRCRCRTLVFAYRVVQERPFCTGRKATSPPLRSEFGPVSAREGQKDIYRRSLLLLTSLSSEIYSLQNPPTAC